MSTFVEAVERLEKPSTFSDQKIDPFCVEKNLRNWASSRIIGRGLSRDRRTQGSHPASDPLPTLPHAATFDVP